MQNEHATITQTTSLSQAALGASSAEGGVATTEGGDGIKIVETEKRNQYEYLDKELSAIFLTVRHS